MEPIPVQNKKVSFADFWGYLHGPTMTLHQFMLLEMAEYKEGALYRAQVYREYARHFGLEVVTSEEPYFKELDGQEEAHLVHEHTTCTVSAMSLNADGSRRKALHIEADNGITAMVDTGAEVDALCGVGMARKLAKLG